MSSSHVALIAAHDICQGNSARNVMCIHKIVNVFTILNHANRDKLATFVVTPTSAADM